MTIPKQNQLIEELLTTSKPSSVAAKRKSTFSEKSRMNGHTNSYTGTLATFKLFLTIAAIVILAILIEVL